MTLSVVESRTTLSTAHRRARAYPHVAAWLDERETQDKAARTLDSDERITAALLLAYPEHELADFTRDDLMAFFAGVTSAQRNKYRSHVNTFFKWAVDVERLERSPMDRVPIFRKPRQKVILTYSDAEIEALCAGTDGPLYRLLFDVGLRFSEAMHMQVKHVLFSQRVVTVMRGAKGGKQRLVPMTQRLFTELDDWFRLDALTDERDAYLWSTRPGGHVTRRRDPIGETALRNWHRTRQREAGVTFRNFHTTRHTMATYFLRNGVSLHTVSKMLGHESVETTASQYAHLVVNDYAAELAALGV